MCAGACAGAGAGAGGTRSVGRVEGLGKPHGQHSERPRNVCSVPVARCLALSKCSRPGVRGPAGSLMSAAVEEAEPREGQTYWGGGSVQGAGGWA